MDAESPPMTLPRVLPATLAIGAALLLTAPAAGAAEPSANPLAQVVAKGSHLFAEGTFGGNGKSCESCHTDGGKGPGVLPNGRKLPSLANAAAIFPRYSESVGQVITLEGQIRQCVKGALGGTPPDYGSPDLVALATYLGSIAHRQPVDIGGAPK